MFLSKLTTNAHSRQVRTDLNDSYQMHRTLMRAFPDQQSGGPGRVLFRIEEDRETCLITVLVQSDVQPDWKRLPEGYLVEPAACKRVGLTFQPGQRLRFRLRANPTVKRDGKRYGLYKEEQQRDWLKRKGTEGGFRIVDCQQIVEGFQKGHKAASTLTCLAVRFEGLLEVIDVRQFDETLSGGIGSAKGLGFGLLSLARAEE